VRDRVIGWLTLGRPPGEPLRGELLMVAEAVARRAALAIDNARAHAELHEIGHTLQRSLLPASVPVVPGLDIGVVYESAGEYNDAGGDFYDFFPLGNGRWCFVVGDVCGTGPEAAAVTGMARHTVRALMRSGFPVGTTLERLNEAILDEGERGRFLTLVCGTLEATGAGWYRVRMVCAGHPPPFLLPRGDPRELVRRIGRPQPLLGVLDVVDYTEEDYQLARGDRLVLVTDGVLERRDGPRMFDDEGVEAVLADSGRATAQGVAERLLLAVTDFSAAPQSDDLAILVLDLGTTATDRGRDLGSSP
jgi:serine phosphatase RsbU (regulator of sigma subunit)